MSVETVRVEIVGRVQGVGYRAWTHRTAARMGLAGFVRNRRDGTVEAVFQGPAETVAAMIAACRSGPGLSRVVDVRVVPHEGSYSGFVVMATM